MQQNQLQRTIRTLRMLG